MVQRSVMGRPFAGGMFSAMFVVAGLNFGGCAPTHGVDVYNATGEYVTVEMLSHDAAGDMNVYSTATLNRDATFINSMESPVKGQSLRARFRLEDQTLADENWVMLNLPEKTTRYYRLELIDGRLKAIEEKRGRPERAKVIE